MPKLFDLPQARRDGVPDKEIADYLAGKHGFDVAKARAEKVTDTQVIDYLMIKKTPTLLRGPENKVPQWGRENPNLYGAFGAAKEAYQQIGKPLTEAGGLVGGGILGTAAGPAGTVAGAGLGYGIAKKSLDIIDRQIQKLEGIRKQGASVKQETLNSLYNVRDGMMMEMGGQAAGAAVAGGIGKVTAPFSERMTPAAQNLRAEAAERGITLTPAEITGSKTLSLGEALMEKVPGSTDIIREMRVSGQLEPMLARLNTLKNTKASGSSIDSTGRKIWEQVDDYLRNEKLLKGDKLNQMRTEVIAKLGTNETYYSMGLRGQEILKAKSIAARGRASDAYADVQKHLPEGAVYETPGARKYARTELESMRKQAKQDPTLKKYLEWSSDEIPPGVMAKIDELPPKLAKDVLREQENAYISRRDWGTLQKHSDELGALIRQEKAVPGMGFQLTPKGRTYVNLKKAVDADMKGIAGKQGGAAWEQLTLADTLWGKYSETYKARAIKSMSKANPERVVDVGFVPGGTTEVKLIKKATGERGFNELRGSFTNKLMGVGKGDMFDPRAFGQSLSRYGDEMLTEVYGKQAVGEFKRIATEGLDLGVHRPGKAFLRALQREYPETVVDRIIGSPEAKLQSHTLHKNIQVLKGSIKKQEFDDLGENLLNKLFQINQETGSVRPQTFAKMVDKYGDRVLSDFYPKAKVNELKTLARIGHRIESAEKVAGNPSGTGQTLIAWGLFRMIMNNPVTGSVIAYTPKQLARIYRSKFGMRWLTEGFKVPTSSKKGVELATKLTAIAGTDDTQ